MAARNQKIDLKVEIGNNLRDVRTALGYSQRQLCDTLNVEYTTWNMWEKGKRIPDPLIMLKFQRAFQIPMGYVYGNEIAGIPYEIMQRILNKKLE